METDNEGAANYLLDNIVRCKYNYLSIKKPPKLNNLKLETLYRVILNEEEAEWKGETEDKYIIIRVHGNFVGYGIGECSYDRDNNMEIIGLGKSTIDLRNINILAENIELNIPDKYYEFDWN